MINNQQIFTKLFFFGKTKLDNLNINIPKNQSDW
jgi:hypothetical protein